MRLSLLLTGLLPAAASAFWPFGDRGDNSPTANDFSGDTITVDIVSSSSDLDQFRIVTKPRPGYDPSTDKVEVYKKDGYCVDANEIMAGDDTPKSSSDCCWNIREFHIWPEKQNVEIGSDFKLDYKYGGGGQCSKPNGRGYNRVTVGPGTYNSYMIQVWTENWMATHFERVIRFPNQDVIGVAYSNTGGYNNGVLYKSDEFFEYQEKPWNGVYQNVESQGGRGTDIGWSSSFEINCEGNFNARSNCPVLSQGGDAVAGGAGAAPSPIVDVEVNGDSCAARGWGDPHMVTFDGFKYDVHVKGEITFLKSLDSSLEIQARTEAVENHAGKPAVTTGIVVHENDDLPTIQVSLAQDADTSENVEVLGHCPIQLFVDGESMPLSGGTHSTSASVHTEGKEIFIQYSTQLKVVMKVEIWMQTCHFTVDYILGDCRKDERIIGVLGTPNKNWRDDWMDRDGKKIDYPVPMGSGTHFEPAYNYVRDNWCIIKESESYFTYEPGTDFDFFDKCDNPYPVELEEAVENADPDLVEKCEGDIGCIIDGDALGTEAADEYLEDPGNDKEPAQTEEDEEIVTTIEGDESNVCEMCKATGWGDPHIITFDGVKYDVHVKGELTFLKSLNSGFEIQARTQAVENHPQRYAVTTGIVVKEDNLPKIQISMPIYPDKADNVVTMRNCPVQLLVDDVSRNIRTGSGTLDATVQTHGNRIVVEYPSTGLQLDMEVTSWRNTCHFSIDYLLGDCRCGETLVGILGNPNGDWHDDWMEEDGTPVDIPPDDHCRRFECGYDYSKTWCVTEETSNFAYEEGTDFDTFDECTEDYDEEMEEVVEEASEDCKTKCMINGELDAGCVIDCEVLGGEAGDEYVEKEENTPTVTITANPTSGPTSAPTPDPTAAPTPDPTAAPTPDPTAAPTPDPTAAPTPDPTAAPTPDPTAAPTTSEPTAAPTVVASGDPTAAPVTSEPTDAPTPVASGDPTAAPVTSEPTAAPTPVASSDPTAAPITSNPTSAPTEPITPVKSGSQGDPHFKTWKNEHFEYHGQCDLLLTKDPNFADGLGLDVQIRTKLVRFWSYIKTAAIRIGDDIFEIEGSADGSGKIEYWYNFVHNAEISTVGGFPVTFKKLDANRHKTIVLIDLGSKYPGHQIEISTWNEFVKVNFLNGSVAAFGNTVGMLGDFKTGKTLARDGVTEMHDFWALGKEWQVRPTDDMLFHRVEQPQFPKGCVEPEDPQGERRRRLEESSISEEDAEKACAAIEDPIDRKDCIYDVLATQNIGMTGAY